METVVNTLCINTLKRHIHHTEVDASDIAYDSLTKTNISFSISKSCTEKLFYLILYV